MNKFYTYIIKSESTQTFYIGHTHNLDDRLYQHNTHEFWGSTSTKRLKGPWRLVYFEEYNTRAEAMNREKQFKSWKSNKTIRRFIDSQPCRVPASRD